MKVNWSYVLLGLAAAFALTLTACSGIRADKVVKVDRPDIVNQVLSPEAPIERESLADAEFNFMRFKSEVELGAKEYAAEIKWGQRASVMIDSILGQGMDLVLPLVGELPGGGLIVAALTGAAGLLFRRPGDRKVIESQEKDNENLRAQIAGMREAIELNTKARQTGN
jgi:hypothetical protein